MWEQITSAIQEFFNQDIVVIISSILTALGSVLIILSKTSIGTKAIAWFKTQIGNIEKTSKETHEKVKEIQTLANTTIERLNAEYEAKTRILVSYYELLEKTFVEMVELIPNAKVQNKLVEFKANFDEQKKQIVEVIDLTYDETMKIIDDKVNEAQVVISEKEQVLNDAINKANELIAKLEYKVEEEENGEEREETINTDREEETI